MRRGSFVSQSSVPSSASAASDDLGGMRASRPMIDTLVGNASTSTSDPTANLLSGLIGASVTSSTAPNKAGVSDGFITLIAVLVGAAASVAGSIIVNRRERKTALRYEVYLLAADLVPWMDEVPRPQVVDPHDTEKQLDTLARLGAIAGRDERRLTFEAWQQWLKARNANGRGDGPAMTSHLVNASNALDELLKLLQEKLD